LVPDDFTASANGRFQIDLSWIKGSHADFTYIEWSSIADSWSMGEGNLLYNGSDTVVSHSGISPGTTCFYQAWSYNVTDNVFSLSFAEANDTTFDNHAPILSNVIPLHNEINIDKMQSFLSVDISDFDGDLMSWTIEVSTGDNNVSFSPMGNGTIYCSLTTPLVYDEVVIWYVNVSDGFDWTNDTYSFIVESDSSGGNGGDNGGGTGGGDGKSKPDSEPDPIKNKDPIANAGGPYYGFVDEIIEFNSSLSYDIDQYIQLYSWEFGDGSSDEGEIVTHTYSKPGIYNVVLMVKDPKGASNTNETVAIIVQPNSPPSIPNIIGPTEGLINIEYTFSIVSTDEDNDSIKYIVDWGDETFDISNPLPSGEFINLTHKWSESGKFSIKVTVDDNVTISTNEMEIQISEPYTPQEYNIWLIIILIIALLVLLVVLYYLETRKRNEK
jgi:PKD repeat protein